MIGVLGAARRTNAERVARNGARFALFYLAFTRVLVLSLFSFSFFSSFYLLPIYIYIFHSLSLAPHLFNAAESITASRRGLVFFIFNSARARRRLPPLPPSR